MVSLFKEKTSIGVFRLILLSLVVHAHFFVSPPVVAISGQSVLLFRWVQPLAAWPSMFLMLLYHIIIIIQALRLNYILINNRLFAQSGFTVAMCYILFTALLPGWCNITAALLINILIIWLIQLLCRLYTSQQAGRAIFNIGLLTGISILLYAPSLPLLPIIFISIFILRPFRINQVFTYVIGVILPFYFLGAYLYLTGDIHRIFLYLPKLAIHVPATPDKVRLYTAAGLVLLCTLSGFIYLQSNIGKLVIMARKCWIILVLLFVFLLPGSIISYGYTWLDTFIVLPAAAAISGNLFFYNKQKIILSVLFWLLLFASWFYGFGGLALLHK